MKLSRKVFRIKRQHVSLLAMTLFIGLGMTVTYVLNTQLAHQKQIVMSRAAETCQELDCVKQSKVDCDDLTVCTWLHCGSDDGCSSHCVAKPQYRRGQNNEYAYYNCRQEPEPAKPNVCGTYGIRCCSDSIPDGTGSNVYCNGDLVCNNLGICGKAGEDDPKDPVEKPDSGTDNGPICSGTCANINNYSCSTGFEKGLCPGTPNNVQCCSGELNDKAYSPDDTDENPPGGGPGPDQSVKKPAPPPPGADDPKGVVDQNDGHQIRGWAFDPDDTDKSLEIHIYIYPEGGSAEGYNTGGTTIDRSDVNDAYGIHGYHGFDWTVPGKWCDGKSYTADVFAINTGAGGNTTLGGSTWTCGNGGQEPNQSQNPNKLQQPNGLSESDALLKKNFDGRWYLSEYTDVRKDKGYGKNSDTAFEHYLRHGMSEKRNPNANFDEKYYLNANPDVAAAVSQGVVRSGFEHYLLHGIKSPECRKPKADRNAPPPYGEKQDADSKSDAKVDVTIALQGIGPGADIKNPVRPADIKIINGNKTVSSASDFLTYDKASGNFVNHSFDLGVVAPGPYKLILQMDGYLDKELIGPDGTSQLVLSEGEVSKAAPSQMIAGDNAPLHGGDNKIDVIDYNALIGCMPGSTTGACSNKRLSDLNDDGIVDQKDLNILKNNMGELGFILQLEEYKCEANPACGTGKDSLQMCSLLCTKKTQRS